jgi:hypothetical protein
MLTIHVLQDFMLFLWLNNIAPFISTAFSIHPLMDMYVIVNSAETNMIVQASF